MPQDPSKFKNEDDFRQSLARTAKPSPSPAPKGRDTRILATSGTSGSFVQFPNINAAYAELNRLKQFDPDEYERQSDDIPGFKGTSSALRKRDAWADREDTGYAIDPENKAARAKGFTSVVDYMEAIKTGIKNYEKNLPKQSGYGATALGGTQGSYPSQGKMSKAMGVKNVKPGQD